MSQLWFKFYPKDYLSEPKFVGVDANRRSCFLTLLCHACNEETPGKVNMKHVSEDVLMLQSGVLLGGQEWERTSGFYDWLVDKGIGFIEGDYFVLNTWDRRQSSYLTDAERARKYRQKSKVRHEDAVTTVTLDKKRIDKSIEVADAPIIPVFERKIRDKDEEYRALVKDLAACDYLTTRQIHDIVLEEFLPYWLEKGEGARKARWEKESAFDYQRRIRTWLKNFHQGGKNQDWKCVDGRWHQKGERCHCSPEEKTPKGVMNPDQASLVSKIAMTKRV